MRGERIILSPGQRFGRYVVIKRADCRSWLCECDCGKVKNVYGAGLVRGRALGCIACRPKPDGSFKHGCEPWPLYQVWSTMRQRCSNPKSKSFTRYGARGIDVCTEWQIDFVNFRDWALANGYQDGLSIEREHNDKGYNPDNCKWATDAEQSVNKRTTRRVKYQGTMVPIATLAHAHGIPIETLSGRIRLKWPIDRALTEPVHPRAKS
jgi:hypothetical protein